jgi:hypothetical protein
MKRRPANASSWATALYSSQTYSEQKADEIVSLVRIALQRMLDGTAEPVHFMRCGSAVNMAAIRAEQIGGNGEAMEILMAAGEALKEAEGIQGRHGKYGLTGLGRLRLATGIEAYEAILRASSPRQMHLAEQELLRRLDHMQRRAA